MARIAAARPLHREDRRDGDDPHRLRLGLRLHDGDHAAAGEAHGVLPHRFGQQVRRAAPHQPDAAGAGLPHGPRAATPHLHADPAPGREDIGRRSPALRDDHDGESRNRPRDAARGDDALRRMRRGQGDHRAGDEGDLAVLWRDAGHPRARHLRPGDLALAAEPLQVLGTGMAARKKPSLPASPQVLDDLVAANRILAMEGVLDGYGHVSVRAAGKPGHFVMSRSLAPQLVARADLMEHGADSEPVGDSRRGYLERFIHGEIYRTRPDVMAVVHSHAQPVVPFGVTRGKLRPVFHMASFLWGGVPVYDMRRFREESDLLVRDRAMGGALAKTLGPCPCVLMRGHGMTVVGDSLQEVVFRAIYTMVNAKLQLQAGQLEGPIEFLSDAEGKLATASNRPTIERPWELWK